MKMRWLIPVLLAVVAAPAAMTQTNEPVKVSIPTKMGVVNLQVAILSTAEGKQAMKELQAQFAPRYAELQTLQKKIEDDQARMRTGQQTLSDEEQARLQEEATQLQHRYQLKSQEMQDDSTEAQQEAASQILRRIVAIVGEYSKKNGFAMVLDNSSQQTPVLYASNQVDITQDIIRLYDQNYPLKTTAAPKTNAPKQP